VPENIYYCKHKDWPVNFIYQTTTLAQAQPMQQTLQAPLFLMAGAGKVLSLSSLSAVIATGFRAVEQQVSAITLQNRIVDIGKDVSLASSLTQSLNALIGTYVVL
jgi:hypothetical protein